MQATNVRLARVLFNAPSVALVTSCSIVMSQIILHIGTHKTGTTSIQKYLSSLREELLACGILYPTKGRLRTDPNAPSGHHLLAWSIRSKNGFYGDKYWLEVLREIDSLNHNVAVLSSEDFENCSGEQVEKIRHYLEGRSVKIIVYVRNQFDFTVSRYKQNVKTGNCNLSFRSYLEKTLSRCDYGRLVAPWIRCFGEDHVEVAVFERARQGAGLEVDFLRRVRPGLEIDYLYLPDRERANVSPDDDQIAIARFLNVAEYDVLTNRYVKRFVHKLRRHVITQTIPGRTFTRLVAPFLPEALCNDEDRAWLREAVKPFNAEFLPKYVAPEDWMYFEI